jgi:hypothetical protein
LPHNVVLDQNSRVSALGTSGLVYDHPTKLGQLYRGWKKHSQRYIDVANTVDKLVFNHQLVSTSFYNICNFIYMIREPKSALANIIQKGYSDEYYAFRLRRMCEMAVKTPNAVLLTYDQLIDDEKRGKKFKQIENMLNLKTPLMPYFTSQTNDKGSLKEGKIITNAEESNIEIPQHLLERCNSVYSKYSKFLVDHFQC